MDKYPAWKRSEIMRRIRSADTKPEIRLRKALFARGFRYRIHVSRLPGTPDIVLAKYRAAIQVRGCFWHAHGDCHRSSKPKSNAGYWLPKLARNKARDARTDGALLALGWRVIVVWECRIATDRTLRRKASAITRHLRAGRTRSSVAAPR